jgi:solute carrier family 12 (potassium/chloride transporters), member 9
MTFLVTNLACFLLKISSAPNFRPSFRYFTWQTAAFGTLISGASMFFVDGFYATGCIGLLIVIFLLIHYTTPPKSWGDVSQSLIYHQVRKYLLRLRQEHVKFWRPQILLLVNDPRRQYKLIQFCNALKKGGLFVIGHIIVSNDFSATVPEARKQQAAWTKYIDLSKIKAFIDIAISPSLEWGSRNLLMNAGLGGMRPNIVVMGMYNLELFKLHRPLIDIPTSSGISTSSTPPRLGSITSRHDSEMERMRMVLPTDTNRQERDIAPAMWVRILEDLLRGLRINVAIAKGFNGLHLPDSKTKREKKFIDLWPIQMSAEIATEEGQEKTNALTTNFDTYTLILQLGCILNTVPKWKKSYRLRVAVFVEYESDVEEERRRLQTLLYNLRIKAEVIVFWLASGELLTYKAIVDGDYSSSGVEEKVDKVLAAEDWWQEIQKIRGRRGEPSASEQLAEVRTPTSGFFKSMRQNSRPELLRNFIRSFSRRRSTGNLANVGPRLSMTTQRLDDEIVNQHAVYASASESSEDESEGEDEDGSGSEAGVTAVFQRIRSTSLADEGEARGRPRPILENIRHHSDEGSTIREVNTTQLERSSPREARNQPLDIHTEEEQSSDTPAIPKTPGSAALLTPLSAPLRTPASMHSTRSTDSRPRPSRRSSAAKFSSNPVPETTLSTEDGPGPSIMFAEPTHQRSSARKHSIYDRGSQASASGFPGPQSIPLSFNDLPCRGQHLILNELIKKQSAETAVVFTTLPSPEIGTCESEDDSIEYLSDLEVLLDGLPPVMMIHSNNMTVTVNL